MFEMFWIEFLERFDVVGMVNQVQNQGVVDNNHVQLRNINIVEVSRSCLVKFVKIVKVTLSRLHIPVSALRRTQFDKLSYCSQTLQNINFPISFK